MDCTSGYIHAETEDCALCRYSAEITAINITRQVSCIAGVLCNAFVKKANYKLQQRDCTYESLGKSRLPTVATMDVFYFLQAFVSGFILLYSDMHVGIDYKLIMLMAIHQFCSARYIYCGHYIASYRNAIALLICIFRRSPSRPLRVRLTVWRM